MQMIDSHVFAATLALVLCAACSFSSAAFSSGFWFEAFNPLQSPFKN